MPDKKTVVDSTQHNANAELDTLLRQCGNGAKASVKPWRAEFVKQENGECELSLVFAAKVDEPAE